MGRVVHSESRCGGVVERAAWLLARRPRERGERVSVMECGYCAKFACGFCEYETRRRADATPFCNKCGSSLMHKHPIRHQAGTTCKYSKREPKKKDRTPGVDWRRKKGER